MREERREREERGERREEREKEKEREKNEKQPSFQSIFLPKRKQVVDNFNQNMLYVVGLSETVLVYEAKKKVLNIILVRLFFM